MVAPGAAAAAPAASTPDRADFNNDGYSDLVIGAHTAPVGDITRAGVISVAYGSATGLRYDTATILSRATEGVPGDPAADERWREVTAYGDLDGDGYDDLVLHRFQTMTVLWGGKNGLTGAGTIVPDGNYTATSPKILAGNIGVGDVNGDGVDDLVSRAHHGRLGAVVLLGPLNRSTGLPASFWTIDTISLANFTIDDLYVGDTTGDGIDDIAVTGDRLVDGRPATGLVFKGSKTGLVKGSTWKVPSEYNHIESYPSAFGDLNRDGYQDLATGWPEQNRIHVAYGGPDGLAATPAQRTYTQASSGVPGISEDGDRFGSAVAIGDTDADGYNDLVIGSSYETGADATATAQSGAITVLRGSATGLTTTGAKSFTQTSAGIPSTSEVEDHFGAALVLSDTDKSGSPELYVGGNGEDGYRGRVWKLVPGATGLTGAGATSITLANLGGPVGGNFGYRLVG